MNIQIPDGLTELLEKLTLEILRNRPDDIYLFAAKHFKEIVDKRENENPNQSIPDTTNKPADSISIKNEKVNDEELAEEEEEEDDEMGEMPDLPKNRYVGPRRHSVAAEKYNPEEDTSDEPPVIHPKSEQEREFLHNAVAQIFMFRSLEQKQLECVLDAMFARDVIDGDAIIEQGDEGDNFYIIEYGIYDIHVNKSKVRTYENQGSFGELALMYNMPRTATVISMTKGKLWALDRLTFKRIVLKSAFEKRKMYENLLINMPMFKSLNNYERLNVADALVSREFKDGDAIIRQGEQAKCMYFIETGHVRIVIELDGETKEIKSLTKGDYFGELALLTKKPRSATVYAVGHETKCAILDVDAFERLLGPCVKLMQKNISDYQETVRKLFGDKVLADLEKK
jgi:cAMP-dependent protein kinase regulator